MEDNKKEFGHRLIGQSAEDFCVYYHKETDTYQSKSGNISTPGHLVRLWLGYCDVLFAGELGYSMLSVSLDKEDNIVTKEVANGLD